tara:strand:- start:744 stop:1142 length:399 start_codon:yes stop_codon:yes gene_type:complete
MRTCNECNKETDNFYKKDIKCRKCKNERCKSSLSHRFHNSKRSAKERGYVFELTKQEYGKITNSNCIYCGELDGNEKKKYVGIDRVNNNDGYTISNCVPCCKICNSMKSNLTYYQFINHVEKIFKKNNLKFM